MSGTATLVKTLNERQALYKLSYPVAYGWRDDPRPTTSFVVASKAIPRALRSLTNDQKQDGVRDQLTECLVFPAEESGEMIELLEIGGSYCCPGGHAEALKDMGFEIVGVAA